MLKVRKKKKSYIMFPRRITLAGCVSLQKRWRGGLGEDSEGMEERKMGDLPSKKFMWKNNSKTEENAMGSPIRGVTPY